MIPLNYSERKTFVNPALIVIPDISGFTAYMSNADLAHSQVKIAQLLETILDNNYLNLSLSEIEGDAILFYDFNHALKPDQVIEQCKLMFKSFHKKLDEFNNEENCQCGSCKVLQQLSLKFVIHYGNLGSVMVKDYCKLFGLDLITAHRLLKNNIPLNEYMLFTEAFMNTVGDFSNLIDWTNIDYDNMVYENIGKVNFSYASLTPLLKVDHQYFS